MDCHTRLSAILHLTDSQKRRRGAGGGNILPIISHHAMGEGGKGTTLLAVQALRGWIVIEGSPGQSGGDGNVLPGAPDAVQDGPLRTGTGFALTAGLQKVALL